MRNEAHESEPTNAGDVGVLVKALDVLEALARRRRDVGRRSGDELEREPCRHVPDPDHARAPRLRAPTARRRPSLLARPGAPRPGARRRVARRRAHRRPTVAARGVGGVRRDRQPRRVQPGPRAVTSTSSSPARDCARRSPSVPTTTSTRPPSARRCSPCSPRPRCASCSRRRRSHARRPATLTSLASVLEDVELTRARGYGLDDEENEPGARCVAAAIVDRAGRPVGAVSVLGPDVAHRRAVRWSRSGERLGEVAIAISQQL